jgi:hypothetical protein
MQLKSHIAFFFIFNILIFTIIPFGSATHLSLQQFAGVPIDDLIKFEKVAKYLNKFLGDDIFFEQDISKLGTLIENNLEKVQEPSSRKLLRRILHSEPRKAAKIYQEFVSQPGFQQKFKTDHDRFLQPIFPNTKRFDYNSDTKLDERSPGLLLLVVYVGFIWIYALNFQIRTVRQLLENNVPFKHRLIAHSLFTLIQLSFGIIFTSLLYQYDETRVFPTSIYPLPSILSILPGVVFGILDYHHLIPGTTSSLRMVAPSWMRRRGRDEALDDSHLEIIEFEFV